MDRIPQEKKNGRGMVIDPTTKATMIPLVMPFWGWSVVIVDKKQAEEIARKIEWAKTAILSL